MKGKKIVSIVLVFLILFSTTQFVLGADDSKVQETLLEYGLLEPEGFENHDRVTRYECVNAIIKSIGATENIESGARGLMYDCYTGMPMEWTYWDGDGIGPSIEKDKYFDKKMGYINLAFFHGIARGEFLQGRRYFYFDRSVTLKETCAFLMRCLKGTDLTDLDKTFEMAKAFGIIKITDLHPQDGDSLVTPEYFCFILQRFLEQKRFLYFDETYGIEIQNDRNGSMTYLEYLQSRESK